MQLGVGLVGTACTWVWGWLALLALGCGAGWHCMHLGVGLVGTMHALGSGAGSEMIIGNRIHIVDHDLMDAWLELSSILLQLLPSLSHPLSFSHPSPSLSLPLRPSPFLTLPFSLPLSPPAAENPHSVYATVHHISLHPGQTLQCGPHSSVSTPT